MSGNSLGSTLSHKEGVNITLTASLWPKGKSVEPGMVEVRDPGALMPPTASVLLRAVFKEGGTLQALVHGYGASVLEEAELWEKQGLLVVGAGNTAFLLDAHTGAVRLRVPMGGYFNGMHLSEDGRDVFLCGDETVVRVVPPGQVGWSRQLGVDGVMVHRAVGPTVFVSAQRRLGGNWVDYLLDRTTGSVTEAPEADETDEPEKPKDVKPAAKQPVKLDAPQQDAEDELDDASVHMVRDDETDPDDE